MFSASQSSNGCLVTGPHSCQQRQYLLLLPAINPNLLTLSRQMKYKHVLKPATIRGANLARQQNSGPPGSHPSLLTWYRCSMPAGRAAPGVANSSSCSRLQHQFNKYVKCGGQKSRWGEYLDCNMCIMGPSWSPLPPCHPTTWDYNWL